MEQHVEIVIDGEPVGKGRPKFARQGNYVKTYTPEKTAEYENLIQTVYRLTAKNEQYQTVYFPADTPVSVHIRAFYGIPKHTGKAKSEEMLSGRIVPLKKPDLNNICKIVCDALNGIAYADDKQIAELSCCKFYSRN
ncbi:MAG: RusA family crossover junction endodeoxyribonuclease, partial [Ruminococcus sp.]|nr:RusA family crossover junction endodeoxyribonuclease [Ruminococcus sp.]